MSTEIIDDTEQNWTTCQHQWWNLIHVTCCMKCGQGR